MLRDAYQAACLAELGALKPGNVHAMADGHGMKVEQFVQSATLSAPFICDADLSVGQRILQAAQATWQGVGCNTNLGILLLCAPLAYAYQHANNQFNENTIQQTLQQLSVQDAVEAYQAITLMNPAGLGKVATHDVHETPDITLLQAMQEASAYDLVAKQYATVFSDVLQIGIPTFKHYATQWDRAGWAVTAVYLAFLSRFADSHVARKYGLARAQALQSQAQHHYQSLIALENPKTYFRTLLDWDTELKAEGINPGTCADLTVATLFCLAMQGEKI